MVKGKIVCPRGKEPQIIKNAETKFASYKAALKWGGSTKSKSDGGKPTGKKSIEFKNLDERSQKKMHEIVLAMTADYDST